MISEFNYSNTDQTIIFCLVQILKSFTTNLDSLFKLISSLIHNGQIFRVKNRMGVKYWVQKLYAVNEMYEVALSILKTSVFHVFVSDTNISSLATLLNTYFY